MDVHPIVRAWLDGKRPEDVTAAQWRALSLIVAGAASEAHYEAAGRDFCDALKSDGDLLRQSTSTEGAIDKAAGEGVIRWIMSSESPDRCGDIIRQRGWELKRYKNNPVVLFAHNHEGEPIGRADNLVIEEIKGMPALVGDIRFAVEQSEIAARLHRLAAGQFLQAGSVGFLPIKTTIPNGDEERAKLNLGRFGVLYEKAELLEFSLCAVPCHPSALQRAIKDGSLSDTDARWAEALADPTEKEWEKLMRERARSFVDMGKGKLPPTDNAELPTNEIVIRTVSDDCVADALKALADSQQRHADALDALARSITDLTTYFGVERKTNVARSAKAEAPTGEMDPLAVLGKIKDQITRHLQQKQR